jgi:hypothetical protein
MTIRGREVIAMRRNRWIIEHLEQVPEKDPYSDVIGVVSTALEFGLARGDDIGEAEFQILEKLEGVLQEHDQHSAPKSLVD